MATPANEEYLDHILHSRQPRTELRLSIGDDFNEWRGKIFWLADSLHIARYLTNAYRGQEEFFERSTQAAVMILPLIHTDILRRVPSAYMTDTPRLLDAVKSRCRTFRFMDLPPEIRMRVYSFLPDFPTKHQTITIANLTSKPTITDKATPKAEEKQQMKNAAVWGNGDDQVGMKISLAMKKSNRLDGDKYSNKRFTIKLPITQVCSTMRVEVSRELFKNRNFLFQFVEVSGPFVSAMLLTWAREVAQSYLKDIQGLCVTFNTRRVQQIDTRGVQRIHTRGVQEIVTISVEKDNKTHFTVARTVYEGAVQDRVRTLIKHSVMVKEESGPVARDKVFLRALSDDFAVREVINAVRLR